MSFKSAEELEAEGLTRVSEMRPDTPEPEADPDAMSVDDLDAELLETARQNSLQERLQTLAALEQFDGDGDQEVTNEMMDAESRAYSPNPDHEQSFTPPLMEFDKQGRLTARSKGKGRSN